MEFETEPTNKSAIQGTHELTVCQTTEKIHTWKLNEQQQQLVDASGLSNLIHTAGLVIDRVALMAFFELWSKETNTAQFNGFEMAPSLRDVAYILGVPVTGRVVTTGAVLNKSVEELCFQYLGQVPDCRDCRGSHVKLSWLQSKFSRLSERPTDDEIMYSTRAYLLFLIGSALLPERDRGYVSPKYLPLLSDFEKVQEYAWGAAALAHLYKALSLAVAHSARKRLFGSAALLMGWLYEYIPALRPDMDDPPVHIFPRVLKWTGSTISQQTKNVSVIRKAFSLLQVPDVNWKPYEGVDPASVPKHCVAPDNLCFSRTWLVSFNLKEIYAPDRFARQFGQEQHHPLNDVPAFQRHLWNPAVDWSLMYASEIQRFQQLINAADDGDHAHTSMPATCVGGAAAAAAADVFTPATMARASLGLSLITVVEGVREELPTVARFLEQRRGLPAALATSLSRIRGLIEASPPAPLKRGDAAPQPQPIAVIPPPVMMPAREAQAAVGDGTRTAPHGPEDAEAPGIVSDDAAVPPKERSDEQRRQEEEEEAAAKGSGGGAVRRSSRSCVQAKRFRRVGGKGSRSSDPIVL